MAVYTEVGEAELTAFLADYDIGEAEALKGVAEGVENSNYLLTTTQGQYFLTLYEKRVDPKDLPFFLLTDIPQMSLWNGADASILPGSGEAMGGLCSLPGAPAASTVQNDV